MCYTYCTSTLECGELSIVYTSLLHYFDVSLVMLVGELPWKCRICSEGYKEPAVLRRHMESRHAGSPGFQCTAECGELFVYQSQLVTHRKSCQKAQVSACLHLLGLEWLTCVYVEYVFRLKWKCLNSV